MGKIVMGYWDCKYCGSIKIKGTNRVCPNCGKTRDEHTKFYMEGSVEYLSKEEAATKGKGADWACRYCGSLNSALTNRCQECGANMDGESKDYFELHGGSNRNTMYTRKEGQSTVQKLAQPYEDRNIEKIRPKKESMWECEYCGAMNSESVSNCTSCGADKPKTQKSSSYTEHMESRSQQAVQETTRHGVIDSSGSSENGLKYFLSNYWKHLAIGAASVFSIALIVFGLVMLFMPREKTIEISSVDWKYTVNVESYETYHESDWTVPTGGRVTRTASEIRSYEKVIDHYETRTKTYTEQVQDGYDISYTYSDNGDGTFSEHEHKTPKYKTETRTETYQEPIYVDVPIYDTKYYYDIERWKWKRNTTASGSDRNPYFDEPVLADNERVSGYNKSYSFTGYIVEDEETKTFKIDEAKWEELTAGQTIKVKMSVGVITEYIE